MWESMQTKQSSIKKYPPNAHTEELCRSSWELSACPSSHLNLWCPEEEAPCEHSYLVQLCYLPYRALSQGGSGTKTPQHAAGQAHGAQHTKPSTRKPSAFHTKAHCSDTGRPAGKVPTVPAHRYFCSLLPNSVYGTHYTISQLMINYYTLFLLYFMFLNII